MINFILMPVSIVGMFIVQILGIVAGLFVVPFGLLFRSMDESTYKPFTKFNTNRSWVYEDLPSWLKPWQNIEDGLRGDHRGWWDANSFGKDSAKVFNMFWWSAIRNPFNHFKRFTLGCDVRKYVITKLAGKDYVRDDVKSTGWQVLKATPLKTSGIKLPRYSFYGVWKWPKFYVPSIEFKIKPLFFKFSLVPVDNRAVVIQLGNKIRLAHNSVIEKEEFDYFKGYTFEINPFKDIS